MSSTNRGAERKAFDAYYTPPWATEALLDGLQRDGLSPPHGFDIVLDPCAGDGAILRVLRERGSAKQLAACEIREAERQTLASVCGADMVVIGDSLADALPASVAFREWPVITNPPFSLALEFVQRFAGHNLACFLLRYGILSSEKRQAALDALPLHIIYQLPHRPRFLAGKSSDSTEYIWLVFPPAGELAAPPGFALFRRLPCVPLAQRKRRLA